MTTKLFYLTRICLTTLGDEVLYFNPNDILLVKEVDEGTEVTIRLSSSTSTFIVKETVEEIATAVEGLSTLQDTYNAEKEEEARKKAEERYKAYYGNNEANSAEETVPLADSNSL